MRQALIDINGKFDCLLIEVLQNRKQIEELEKSKIGVENRQFVVFSDSVYTFASDVQCLCCMLYIYRFV